MGPSGATGASIRAWPAIGLGHLGRRFIGLTGGLGRFSLFTTRAGVALFYRPFRWREVVGHLHFFGNRSILIVTLTASFAGMVLALQGYDSLRRFGSEVMVGPVVALSLIRELAPVLAALVVTARAGSAITATLGNMRQTEQIDALEVLSINSLQFLVGTRLLAAVIAVPIATALFSLVGILAALGFADWVLGEDGGVFWSGVKSATGWIDVSLGLAKSLFFGFLIAAISGYRGYNASGGALGVGRATTRAVVETTVFVLIGDFVFTALWM